MKNQKYRKALNIAGFSLLEGMITIGVLSIAGMALVGMNDKIMKSNKSASIRSDLQDIKRTISNLISCDQTLGAAKPTACSGPVTLKDKNGNPLVNGGKIGEWDIEATCESLGSPSTPGLSIYATKPGKIDPIRNLPLDKNHPISSLFNPDVRLCGDNFKDGMSTPAEELHPLYGRKTSHIIGTAAINAILKKGIGLVFNASFNSGTWSNVDAQLHWDMCELKGTTEEQGEKLNTIVAVMPQCLSKICNGFFKNKASPINFSPAGWCGTAVANSYCSSTFGYGVPMIEMGCMWDKVEFDANKEP